MRVWNSGTANITPGDYAHPVSLTFLYMSRARIHRARIVKSSPPDIKELETFGITHHDSAAEPDKEGFQLVWPHDELVLPSMLLHPKDSLTLEAWISSPSVFTIMYHSILGTQVKPTISTVGRVVNVRQFRAHEKGVALRKLWKLATIGIVVSMLAVIFDQFIPLPVRMPDAIVPVLLVWAICLLAVRWRLVRELYGVVFLFGLALLLMYFLASLPRLHRTNDKSVPVSPQP